MGNHIKHIMVSGGSRGLGRSLVEALLDHGHRVSSFSRKPTEFTESKADDEKFFFQTSDMTDHPSLERFVQLAEEAFGCPWGLVNCAGVATDGVLAISSVDQVSRTIGINLGGTIELTRLAVRRMLVADQGGSIVNISSIIGLRGYSGLAVYSATKAGIDAMTRSLARELGPRQIRVNSIAPGYLETEMTHGLDDRQRRQIVNRTPLGRLGQPSDCVGTLLYLLSDMSAFMTGQVLVVDGGITV